MDAIYLDHNATTAVDPEVLEAMRPYWLSAGNPESRHAAGRVARRAWERAKEVVAQILGADPSEVIFTSGGTEANNMAIFGLVDAEARAGRLVASPMEHPAVAEPVARLEAEGFVVNRPDVTAEGITLVDQWAEVFRAPNVCLGTLMLANNETGAIQPVGQLTPLAQQQGIPFHTDAVQAVGRIPVDFHALGTTTLAASAHKFHGPIGVGVLLVRSGVRLRSQLLGGAQQQGRRPGTVAVPLAVGLATALERWHTQQAARIRQWRFLCARVEERLMSALGPELVVRNGPLDPQLRLPQTLNIGFRGLNGDALLMQLDLAGVAISLGSACASGSTRPSPTLIAMRVPDQWLRSSVRISLGAFTTEAEIDVALARIIEVVRSNEPGLLT